MKRKKIDTSIIKFFAVALFAISVIVVLIAVGVARTRFSKRYILFTADNFVNSEVYAESETAKVLLNDNNVNMLSKVLVSGSVYFKIGNPKYTGKEIYFTFVKKDTKEEAYAKVSELSDGPCIVEITNFSGEEMAARLNDVKFSSFVHLTAVNSANGENTVVE